MNEQKQYTEYLKYEYTDAEISDAAKELARANQRRTSIEQQKKEVDSQLKAEIEAQNSTINRLSALISTGSVYRDIECRVELDTPEAGKKRIVRLDTGEEVRIVAMTDADRQMSLELQDAAAAQEAKDEQQATIVTPPPVVLQITAPDPEAEGGAILAQATVMGGTHQRKNRKPRNQEAEGYTDGSEE